MKENTFPARKANRIKAATMSKLINTLDNTLDILRWELVASKLDQSNLDNLVDMAVLLKREAEGNKDEN